MDGTRLQKVLAQAGVASRRAAEVLIREGRVAVNGQVVSTLGVRVDPERDEIRVDGRLIRKAQRLVYLLFNKPRQVVTTLSDPQGRRTIRDLFPRTAERLFPVGRLDYDAEGLLLVTNDGRLAHRLQHPSFGVRKTYEVKVKGHPSAEALERLRSGVLLEEGKTAPAEVSVLKLLPEAAWLRIVLHQGWYRQLKRMGEAVGHPVLKIRRVGYGPLALTGLADGAYRALTPREVQQFYRLVHLDEEQTDRP